MPCGLSLHSHPAPQSLGRGARELTEASDTLHHPFSSLTPQPWAPASPGQGRDWLPTSLSVFFHLYFLPTMPLAPPPTVHSPSACQHCSTSPTMTT